MTNLILHRFGSIASEHKLKPDFDVEEPDTEKRGYTFAVNLDIAAYGSPKQTFREYYDTMDKLTTRNTGKTHKQQQQTDDETWDYCPDCIQTIKEELDL